MVTSSINNGERKLTISFSQAIVSDFSEDIKTSVFKQLEDKDQARQWDQITLDLTKVPEVDSAGLNILVSIAKFAKSNDKSIECTIQDKRLSRIFTFTRVSEIMKVNDLS